MRRTTPEYMREHYFLLPKILFSHELNYMDIAVFVFLRHGESRRYKPGWPTLKGITRGARLCENSVRNALRRLGNERLIENGQTVFNGMDAQQCSGRYFFLPRQIVFLDLTSKELAIYAYLMYLEDRFTNQCWPSYKTIGKHVGVKSSNTVRKFVRMLEWKALIFTEPTFLLQADGTIRNANLRYTIRPITDALDFRHQRQLRLLEQNTQAQFAQQQVLAYTAQHPETRLTASFAGVEE